MARTLHLIGNAHIDPVWLWRWQEGLQEVKATFRSALDRLAESDDFLFCASSAALFEWVERNDPAMFAELAARVREGRLELVGGWWIEADCNLPCGESFARQALYGQRYFRGRFGVTARVGYNPDAFGHHAALPQLLRKSGLADYVFLRPGPHEQALPGRLFWWEAADGSRVLAHQIPFEYASPPGQLEPHVRRCAGELAAAPDDLMCFFGVGNHGGGPTRADLAAIRRMNAAGGLPPLRLSTPGRYFAEVRARAPELPVVRGELQHHARGCYAAHSGIKRWNRRAEALLLCAEKLAVVAGRTTGLAHPADLERGWKAVLFQQFHDVLAGTSLEVAYEDARDACGEATAIAARVLNDAVQSIAWRVDLPAEPGATPIVVFNPHPWPSVAPIELERHALAPGERLVDDEERPVALQPIRSHATVDGWRTRLAFVAELPPLGWRAYRLAARPADAPPSPLQAEGLGAENARFRVELDPESGGLARLVDKAHGVEVLGAPLRALVLEDRSDTWSHGVSRYEGEVGAFGQGRVRLVERGPVRALLRGEARFGGSTLRQDVLLYADPRLPIEVRVTVDWRERHRLLKLRLPVGVEGPIATFEIPFGHVVRPTGGDEEPGQSWLDLSGTVPGRPLAYGLSLLNDGKQSFDVRGAEVGLTVLRSPIYAHHDPAAPAPDDDHAFLDQGVQRFTYALVPHADGWREAETVRRAAELNQPAIALVECFHAGPLPRAEACVALEGDGVVLTALKRAEEGDDLILRAYEAHGRACAATLRLPRWGRTLTTAFSPHEIKTLLIPADPARPVVEVDLLEG